MITMKDIVREGHPSLRVEAKEVQVPPSEEDITLLNDMITFLKNSQDDELAEQYDLRSGVGLAAPQLGINKRLIAIYFIEEDKVHCYQLMNPRIISHSVKTAYLANGEGCLSVDRHVEGYVHRYAKVTIKAININGEEIRLRFRGYTAIIIQHEIDHLNGIMFFDHIEKDNPYFIPENSQIIE